MSFSDILRGLNLNQWTVITVLDSSTGDYLKGGYVKDCLHRYDSYVVDRCHVTSEGVLRFWVHKCEKTSV